MGMTLDPTRGFQSEVIICGVVALGSAMVYSPFELRLSCVPDGQIITTFCCEIDFSGLSVLRSFFTIFARIFIAHSQPVSAFLVSGKVLMRLANRRIAENSKFPEKIIGPATT
jgi:hypothetical protein